jgi:hypothetical protein
MSPNCEKHRGFESFFASGWPKWFSEEPATPDELYALLKSSPNETLKVWPVDKSVGNVRNKGPQLRCTLVVISPQATSAAPKSRSAADP